MVNYWQDSTDTTGTSTRDSSVTSPTATATTHDYVTYVTTTTTYTRKLLVRMPKNWSKRDQDAFINLVNKETSTGWKVEMIISGDVELVDHSIEVVSMDSFVDILRARATAADSQKIYDFFVDKKEE